MTFKQLYKITEKIGAGGFSKVYSGSNRKTKQVFAIKVIKKGNLS